jgi:hypothetical protein
VGLSTRRGSEDAPRPAARDVPNSSRRRPAHRPRATSYAASGADCPSPDTVVLVFMVASQSRLSTQPSNLSAPRVATQHRHPTTSSCRDRSAPDRRSRERIRADTERARLNVGGYHIPPGRDRERSSDEANTRDIGSFRGGPSSTPPTPFGRRPRWRTPGPSGARRWRGRRWTGMSQAMVKPVTVMVCGTYSRTVTEPPTFAPRADSAPR